MTSQRPGSSPHAAFAREGRRGQSRAERQRGAPPTRLRTEGAARERGARAGPGASGTPGPSPLSGRHVPEGGARPPEPARGSGSQDGGYLRAAESPRPASPAAASSTRQKPRSHGGAASRREKAPEPRGQRHDLVVGLTLHLLDAEEQEGRGERRPCPIQGKRVRTLSAGASSCFRAPGSGGRGIR